MHLHFDIISGASGDMVLGALIDAGADPAAVARGLDGLGIEPVELFVSHEQRHSIRGTRVEVRCQPSAAERDWRGIRELISRSPLPGRARGRALAVFERLARAEAHVHGGEPEDAHFHEVGAVDSIADVVGAALALEELGVDTVTSGTVLLGSGRVQARHGALPLPAPAALEILKGAPVRQIDAGVELTTPTGAALIAALADSFGPIPEMVIERVGYGVGARELADRPNLLRAVIGRRPSAGAGDEIQIDANIDDMNPQFYDHAFERLLAAGAHDVFIIPIQMKKNRPAQCLSVLCAEADLERISRVLLSETTTIGLRYHRVLRRKLSRRVETVSTPFGPVKVKVSYGPGIPAHRAPEYDDVRRLAREHDVPAREVYRAALLADRESDEG